MSDVFFAKKRLKSARQSVHVTKDFKHSGPDYDCLHGFLVDLVQTLAEQRPDSVDEAKAYVIRTLGVIVQQEANAAYLPFGYKNPFELATLATPAKPKTPEAPKWVWPVVHEPPASPGGRFDGAFREFSALKLFGYTVGKTNGWPQFKRQKFLSDFMEMALPSMVRNTFGDDYGGPLTATRLRKVANVIASNADLRYRNDPHRYMVAIQHWEADLDFLKAKYYVGHGLQFQPWPDTRA